MTEKILLTTLQEVRDAKKAENIKKLKEWITEAEEEGETNDVALFSSALKKLEETQNGEQRGDPGDSSSHDQTVPEVYAEPPVERRKFPNLFKRP